MGLEFELKYQADEAVLEQLRAAFPGKYAVIPMTTSYYDTPDRALSALHWTLRCRREGARHVCTLKTPAGGLGREEWETECDDIEKAIPKLAEMAGKPELPLLTAGGVVHTCGAKFTREALNVTIRRCKAELALDSGVLVNGDRELPFVEVELELKSGPAEDLIAFGKAFADNYGLKIQPKSKYARARALGKED